MPRQYNPLLSPAENIRLTLADQVENGASAAAYKWPATQEEVIARTLANAGQGGGGAPATTTTAGIVKLSAAGDTAAAVDGNLNPIVNDNAAFIAAIGAVSGGGEGETFITCDSSGTGAENATSLVNAMTAAYLLTPNGLPLSATNYATVIIPPGLYDFGQTQWVIPSPYIRFVGIGMPTVKGYWDYVTTPNGASRSCIVRGADHVIFEGIRFDSGYVLFNEDSTDDCFVRASAPGTNTKWIGCEFVYIGTPSNNNEGAFFPLDIDFSDDLIGCRATIQSRLNTNIQTPINFTIAGTYGNGGPAVYSGRMFGCQMFGSAGFFNNLVVTGSIDSCFLQGSTLEAHGAGRIRNTVASSFAVASGGKVVLCIDSLTSAVVNL